MAAVEHNGPDDANALVLARRYVEDLICFEGRDFVLPSEVVWPSETVAAPSRDAGESARELESFRLEICECTACPLGSTRNQFVFGVGNPNAGIVFVGEAPGAEEDRQGIPFVGSAGQLLTKIIQAMGLTRDDVYICNTQQSGPPARRDRRLSGPPEAPDPDRESQDHLHSGAGRRAAPAGSLDLHERSARATSRVRGHTGDRDLPSGRASAQPGSQASHVGGRQVASARI